MILGHANVRSHGFTAARERASQIADRFLLATIGDCDEVPGQLEQQALMCSRLACARLCTDAFVEKADLDPQCLGDRVQASTGDAIDALSPGLRFFETPLCR